MKIKIVLVRKLGHIKIVIYIRIIRF